MDLFGPNIKKMQARNDTKGLKQAILENENQKTRVKAIRALAEMGKAPTLISLMTDPVLMQVIVPVLVKMGDRAIKPLIKALDHRNRFVQGGAATALSISPNCTYEAIERIAERAVDTTCKARIAMIVALQHFGKGGITEEAVREATKDEDPEISNAAMQALGAILTAG